MMASRTVHVVVHVWHPLGSDATKATSLICLSRTKIDENPPLPPPTSDDLHCAHQYCEPRAARRSAYPTGEKRLVYAPSTTELHLALSSFAQAASPIEHCAWLSLAAHHSHARSHAKSVGIHHLTDMGCPSPTSTTQMQSSFSYPPTSRRLAWPRPQPFTSEGVAQWKVHSATSRMPRLST